MDRRGKRAAGLALRAGLALALSGSLLPPEAAAFRQKPGSSLPADLDSVEELDLYVGEHLDGLLLSEDVPFEVLRDLADRYARAHGEDPARRPRRRWRVDWSLGRRLLSRGEPAAAFEALERARRFVLEQAEQSPAFAPYLWRLFTLQLPLVQAGIGDVPLSVLAEECYAHTDPASPQHPWLLQILVDDLVLHARFARARDLLDDAQESYVTTAAAPIADYLRAYVYSAEGRPELALPLARAAVDSLESDDPFLLPALDVLVEVWMSLGLHQRVADRLPPLLEEASRRGQEGATSRLRLALAMARIELGEPDEATRGLEDLLARRDLPDPLFVQAHNRLAGLALRAGEPEVALEHVAAALPRRKAGELAPEELALPLALGLRASRRSGDAARGRERFLPELRRRFDGLVDLWSDQPLVAGGLGLLRYQERRTVVGETLLAVAATDGDEAAFACLLRVEATSGLARRLGGSIPVPDEVRRLLVPAAGGLIDFFYDEDVLHVFALDGESLVYLARENTPGLGEAVARYQALVQRRPTKADRERRHGEWLREGRPLADVFFPQAVRAVLGTWREVRLVSTEILGGAFAAASLPVLSEEPLGVDRAVSYLPNLAVGLALESKPAPRPTPLDLVLLTNSREATSMGGQRPLVMGASERDELLAPFPAGRTRCLTGSAASLPQLAALLPRTRVLHVFEHGIYLPDEVFPTAATIAPSANHDGVLGARELLALAPLPPLVVLSVCDAGQGAARVGDEGASDLRGACLRAGARTVVFATGAVDQVATQRLMAAFHRGLAEGATPAEALRRSWIGIRRIEGGRFDDPYYFAQIQVLGRAHAPLF